MGKGEIARQEQFLLFPQCFLETCTADMLKQELVWERVKLSIARSGLTLSQMTNFLDLSKPKEFSDDNFKSNENGKKFSKQEENTVGKGEIAHQEQFLLFPQCFLETCTADM